MNRYNRTYRLAIEQVEVNECRCSSSQSQQQQQKIPKRKDCEMVRRRKYRSADAFGSTFSTKNLVDLGFEAGVGSLGSADIQTARERSVGERVLSPLNILCAYYGLHVYVIV
jgi:hypothetical protein